MLKEENSDSIVRTYYARVLVEGIIVREAISYSVSLREDSAGGQIIFTSPVNLVWLEDNFSRFFKASKVQLENVDEQAEISSEEAEVVNNFIATRFAEDGQTIDFAVKAFDPE